MNKKEKEFNLWKDYKSTGDKQARKELIHSLKPLIRSQANKYKNSGLPLNTLELEGTRLAAQAFETYEPERSQLNTHVINNLKKLSRFTTNYQNIGHIPEHRALIIGKYNTIFSNLREEKGREPTIDELSDNLKISPAEVERLQTEQRSDLHMELQSSDSFGEGFSYYVSPNLEDPQQREAVQFVYFDANPIDKKILEYTMGLGGTPKKTNKEIKEALKLSESELKKRRENLAKQIKELL